jgi:hypothetical protein
MIADSDHLTQKFAFSRRAAQPPARRSPTESTKSLSSADDTFFAIPPRLEVARMRKSMMALAVMRERSLFLLLAQRELERLYLTCEEEKKD